jgi:hypothetical protein
MCVLTCISGEAWSDYEERFELDKDLQVRFKRQEQLCQYFIAQIEMLSQLCFGRSYNCITMLQESFSYTTLVSIVSNEHLPCLLRAVMLDLLRVLYVDRFFSFFFLFFFRSLIFTK